MEKTINEIFEKLEKWRNFPKYQLERRLDIFISIYLPEILKKYIDELKNVDVNIIKDNIYPEFPLKKEQDCSSDNADFAVFIKETKTIYLIELKTDMKSINDSQLTYYTKYCPKLSSKSAEEIIKNIFYDIIKIENKSSKYEKYDYLLNELIYGNQTSNPCENKGNRRQWKCDKVELDHNNKVILKDENQKEDLEKKIKEFKNIEIIYITPKKDKKINKNFKTIEFLDIINVLKPKESNDLILERLQNLLNKC